MRQWFAAMRAADPTATLALGGLDCNGNSGDGCAIFVEAIYTNGCGSCFDAVPIHPYGTPLNWDALAKVHAVLQKHGDGSRPLWINEYGWNTKDESQKSKSLIEVLSKLHGPEYQYVELAQYLVLDDLPNTPDTGHDFGLMSRDRVALTLTPRASYTAFKSFNKTAVQHFMPVTVTAVASKTRGGFSNASVMKRSTLPSKTDDNGGSACRGSSAMVPHQLVHYFDQDYILVEAENLSVVSGWEKRAWGDGNYFCSNTINSFHSRSAYLQANANVTSAEAHGTVVIRNTISTKDFASQ
eukprot:SAG22_NODE_3458_length_1700_cov_1.394753_2_plen_297_part_00